MHSRYRIVWKEFPNGGVKEAWYVYDTSRPDGLGGDTLLHGARTFEAAERYIRELERSPWWLLVWVVVIAMAVLGYVFLWPKV